VIGLYIAYAIPIYLRLTNPISRPGPWNLKGHHKLVGWTRSLDRLITILFFAPLFWPFWPIWGDDNLIRRRRRGQRLLQAEQLQLHRPLIILAFLGMWLYWHFSARKWFTGPRVQGTKEELHGHRAGARATGLTQRCAVVSEMGLLRGMRPHLCFSSTRQSIGFAASASQPSNSGDWPSRFAVVESVVGVRDEVGVECADRLLDDGPHAFAKLAHHLHQLAVGPTTAW
jgi:hypothetical protein